ncbi:TonB-dependent receptor [bacterium]|nr:TonB-dependent receptor [bacterium]
MSIDTINFDYYSNVNTKTQASQFVKYETTFNSFDFYVDVEARYVQMGYKDNLSDINLKKDWFFVNPKFGVTKKMGKFISYASFGQVTREPYRLDMLAGYDDVASYNSDTDINKQFSMSNVSPERLNDYEGGLRFVDKGLYASINLYYMDFRNEIVPIGVISNITSLAVRQNVDRSYRRGVEVNISKNIGIVNITSNVNYNESRIFNFTDNTNLVSQTAVDVKNNSHLLSPKWVIKNNLSVNIKSTKLTLTHNYVSQSYLSNNNDSRFVLPQYNILGGRLDTKLKNMTLFLVVDNLLNTRYFTSGQIDRYTNQSAYFVQPTRNFLFGVKISI